jgi:glycerophosphoryl diester phosphodiesterase
VAFGQADPVGRSDGDDGGPEPTALDRLAQVIDDGAGGVATEVWLTADGVPVLSRQGRIGRRFRRRNLGELPAADLPPSVTRLDDLYGRLGTGHPISLDVRDPAALDPVVAAARQAGGERAERELWLCHPQVATLTTWRSRTEARLVNTADYRGLDGGLERRAAELEQRGLDGLRLDHKDWTGGRVTLLHRFGLLALGVGTVHEREAATLIDTGIDGAYSERVASLAAVMSQFYGSA